LALYYLARFTGDAGALRRGRALLLAELEQSYPDGSGLQFRISRKDRRVEPYLASGSAGFALVAGRYLGAGGRGGNAAAAGGGARAGGDPISDPAGGDLIAELGGGDPISDLAGGDPISDPGGGDPADPLAVAYRRCLVSVRAARLPVLPSLFLGLAGMGLVLS